MRALAAGGMGQVWEARDELLDAEVAVKEVRWEEDLSEDEHERAIARAMAEARHAAALRDHPNIVTVHDVVVEDGGPWTVMRLVRGRSLAQVLRADGPLEPERAAEVAVGVLRALAAAHGVGILHRDVKPSNIMLADDGGVLLADFGLAKNHAGTVLTTTGGLVGSLDYIAPERLAQEPDTPAVDLFSLGVTLYEAVEGVSPFRRETAAMTLAAVALALVPPPRRAGRLAPLITALLSRDPAGRPDAVAGLAMLDGPGQESGGAAPEHDPVAAEPTGGPAGAATPTEPDLPAAPPVTPPATPTPTPTVTSTSTPTVTAAATPTSAPTPTPTATSAPAPTPTATPTPTPTTPRPGRLREPRTRIALATAVVVCASVLSWALLRSDDDAGRGAAATASSPARDTGDPSASAAPSPSATPSASAPAQDAAATTAPATPGNAAGPAVADDQHLRVFTAYKGQQLLESFVDLDHEAAKLRNSPDPGQVRVVDFPLKTDDPNIPQVRAGTRPVALLDKSIVRVFFVSSANKHLVEARLEPERKWQFADLGDQEVRSTPTAAVLDGMVNVFTVGVDNHLRRSYLDGSGWGRQDLQDDLGVLGQGPAKPVAAGTAPVAVVADKVLRVYTITESQQLQEASLKSDEKWNIFPMKDVPPSAMTPTAVVHDGVTSVFTVNRDDGHLSETRLTPPGGTQAAGWGRRDLTKDFRVPAPRSAPAALVHGGTTSLFLVDRNGLLTETKAAGDGWTPQDSLANAGVQQVADGFEPAVVDHGGVTRVYTVCLSDGKLQETALRNGTWSTEVVG
ncbi:protein kinase [Kitasatospora sp. NPDC057512]|uniref:serine/threonine-protein kinase n=1 Tax=Kitasatospora sp. NPDC057512 TaxID=3346154 RepID=UPI0036A82980